MGTCFVIQPFDGGKFDKRYKDVFAPAIRVTDLGPYRADHDPSVSIPIEDIQRGIENAPPAWLILRPTIRMSLITDRNFNPRRGLILGFAWSSCQVFLVTFDPIQVIGGP